MTFVNDTAIWMDADCETTSISDALCSSCGEFGESCCSVGSECNDQTMSCEDTRCAYVFADTTTSTTNVSIPETTHDVLQWDAIHDKWTPTLVITVIFIALVVAGILSWYTKKRRSTKSMGTNSKR